MQVCVSRLRPKLLWNALRNWMPQHLCICAKWPWHNFKALDCAILTKLCKEWRMLRQCIDSSCTLIALQATLAWRTTITQNLVQVKDWHQRNKVMLDTFELTSLNLQDPILIGQVLKVSTLHPNPWGLMLQAAPQQPSSELLYLPLPTYLLARFASELEVSGCSHHTNSSKGDCCRWPPAYSAAIWDDGCSLWA